MSNKKIYIISSVNFILSIGVYFLYCFYSNKAHQIFLQKDSNMNLALLQYSNLSKIMFTVFIILVYLAVCILIVINEYKIKGLLYASLLQLTIFIICLIFDLTINKYYFNLLTSCIQYLVIFISSLIFYLLLYVFNFFKNKFKNSY